MDIVRTIATVDERGMPSQAVRVRERWSDSGAIAGLASFVLALGALLLASRLGFSRWPALVGAASAAALLRSCRLRWLDVHPDGSVVLRSGFLLPMWSRKWSPAAGELRFLSRHRTVVSDGDLIVDNDCFLAFAESSGHIVRLLTLSNDDDIARTRGTIERLLGRSLSRRRDSPLG